MTDPRELVAYSSDPAIVVDGRQKVLAYNKAAADLVGLPSESPASLTCDDMLGAVLAEGEAVCCRQCAAITNLRHLHPYASGPCFVRDRAGGRIAANLRTMAIPGDENDLDRPVAIIFIARPDAPPAVSAPADTRLHIQAFGRFSVSYQGRGLQLEQWPRRQSVQLLKLLVAHADRPLHRERLIEHFWPDADAETGWCRLKVTVHSLRQKLREAGFDREAIVTVDSSYVLQTEAVRIDTRDFEVLVREGRDHERNDRIDDAIRCYEEAKRTYRGDFMEGDLYADWCAEDRERLCETYIETLNALAQLHFRRRAFAAAAQECHAALVREPCRESIHRLLMESLIALQRQDSALRQFERCRQILLAELGVEPSAETYAVVAPLLRPSLPRVAAG
ncbi:MAG: winged helix-turn-helix domain-containing protein [Bauldia sp.]|nr:winged helix-turn-helix domain-containing protein [Bauldia sp.]